jgi:DNA-binding MarR family transcriptional regulator
MSDEAGGPLRTSLLFDVFALGQSVGRLLSEAMREGPLTPAEYAVYSAIFELEAASPTALSARLGMRLTTFMGQLRAIEGRGHAARVDNPADRRSYRVVLTAAGLEAHRAANRAFERADAAFRAGIPEGEGPAKAALRTIRQAADAARGDLESGVSRRPRVGRAG